jgi:hypothetical protein
MAWPELATWFPAFLAGTKGALDIAVCVTQVLLNTQRLRVV